MEKSRLEGHVADWRGAEHVPVVRITRYLLQPEIFVLSGTVKGHITCRGIAHRRCDLRHSDYVLAKVAEHFIRLP